MNIATAEFQRALFDRIAEAVAVIDARRPDFPIIEANRVFADVLSATERVVGAPWAAVVPRSEEQGLLDILAHVAASGKPFRARNFPYHAASADCDGPVAEPRYWDWQCLPLGDEYGGVERLMIVLDDVTARVRPPRRAGRTLTRARGRADMLAALVGALADGVFLLDGAGRVIEANEAGVRLLGQDAPLHERRLLEVLVEREWQWDDGRPLHTGDALLTAACCGQLPTDDLVLVGTASGEGRRFLALRATPLGAEGNGSGRAVVVLRDITPQKQAEQEKEAFLSLIAHEVKSPLTAIKGFAQLARRAARGIGDESGDRVARHLQVIDEQAARIGELVDELSDANRLQRGTLPLVATGCDLATVVGAVVARQQATLPTRRFTLTVKQESLPLLADPERLAGVVAALLENAVRYSPGGGEIVVTIERVGAEARLAVRDRGIGIPVAELDRVFERFHRAANVAESGAGGLGLGLYIAREIIVRSGGRIWAESVPGLGSSFHVALPLVVDTEAQAADDGALDIACTD